MPAYTYIGERPAFHRAEDSAERTLLFTCENGKKPNLNQLGEVLSDAHVPPRLAPFPGDEHLRLASFSFALLDEVPPYVVALTLHYTPCAGTFADGTFTEETPWEKPWLWSVRSCGVNASRKIRYNPGTQAYEPHLNTAGAWCTSAVKSSCFYDVMTFSRGFLNLDSGPLRAARGTVNRQNIRLLGRSGECGQFFLRNVAYEQRVFVPRTPGRAEQTYIHLTLEIEYLNRAITGQNGNCNGFYFTVPNCGDVERIGNKTRAIRIPRLDDDGNPVTDSSGEPLYDRVHNWGLNARGAALSPAENGDPAQKINLGPFLADAQGDWSWITALQLPATED